MNIKLLYVYSRMVYDMRDGNVLKYLEASAYLKVAKYA